MTSKNIFFTAALPAALAVLFSAQSDAAVITFSGAVGNGQAQIPQTYQPLLNAYPTAGGNTDGANIGVTITWADGTNVAGSTDYTSNTAANNGVIDHTHLVNASDTSEVIMYDNNSSMMTMIFDKPVTIPDFFYAYFSNPAAHPIFKAYTNAGDATPVATFTGAYPGGNYVWQEETGFGATPIEEITFARNDGNYLQIDDITVNAAAVPEPSTLFAGLSLLGLAASRRIGRKA